MMVQFDYGAAAELFPARRRSLGRQSFGYKRFAEASQAIRFAIEDLPPVFERGMVAIVMDKDEFLGLITPIDLLQYLRKRIGHA